MVCPCCFLFFAGYFWFFFCFAVLVCFALVVFLIAGWRRRNNPDNEKTELLKTERNRIAADIHDDVGAELTNLILMSRHLRQMQPKEESEMKELVTRLEHCSIELVSKMNDVIWYLNTDNHQAAGLFSYIRAHVSSLNETPGIRISLNIDCQVKPEFRLSQEIPRNVLMVTKELLQNGIRHALADHISLRIVLSEQSGLTIDYEDDGVGFDPDKKPTGNGLMNIRRRVLAGGGKLEVDTQTGNGCRMHITLPIRS